MKKLFSREQVIYIRQAYREAPDEKKYDVIKNLVDIFDSKFESILKVAKRETYKHIEENTQYGLFEEHIKRTGSS